MKILPINNILNINKNHNHKPSFKAGWIEDANSYDRVDSYIDETGMHYVHNRVLSPWNEPCDEQINDAFEDESYPRTGKSINKRVFLTQTQYDTKNYLEPNVEKFKKMLQKDLYDLNIDRVELGARYIDKYLKYTAQKILTQPFFALGLADIPLTDANKALYINVLNILEKHDCNVNVMDENGITLLEKVMNSENEPYLATIREICRKHNPSDENPAGIAYDPMQKYAFDNIQNPEFKKKCKILPIKFFDIIDDIERKDLKSLDKNIQEQMKCEFCDIDYAILTSLYIPAMRCGSEDYTRIVFDIAKKHFPKEMTTYIKGMYHRGLYL